MADRYAPALFLEVLAFWFILRWLLVARLVLVFGRILLSMMLVGVLGTLDEHRFVWAAAFAVSALLAWWLLRRWRSHGIRRTSTTRWPRVFAWRGWSGDAISVLCERRLGIKVDAAAPATVASEPPAQCILALAGDGLGSSRTSHGSGIRKSVASWRAGIAMALSRTSSTPVDASGSSFLAAAGCAGPRPHAGR